MAMGLRIFLIYKTASAGRSLSDCNESYMAFDVLRNESWDSKLRCEIRHGPKRTLDVNGDGLADVVGTLEDGRQLVAINAGGEFDFAIFLEVSNPAAGVGSVTSLASVNLVNCHVLDINHDGRDDLLSLNKSLDKWVCYYSQGTNFVWEQDEFLEVSVPLLPVASDEQPLVEDRSLRQKLTTADLNGDGLRDLVYAGNWRGEEDPFGVVARSLGAWGEARFAGGYSQRIKCFGT